MEFFNKLGVRIRFQVLYGVYIYIYIYKLLSTEPVDAREKSVQSCFSGESFNCVQPWQGIYNEKWRVVAGGSLQEEADEKRAGEQDQKPQGS